MEQARKPCLRCLLRDVDESQLLEAINQRIAAMPAAQKAPPEEYARRLGLCQGCNELLSGTCRKCGCYVELRAVRRNSACPHENPRW